MRKIHSPLMLIFLLVAGFFIAGCNKVAPPVSVSKRDSVFGQGIVVVVTNTSADHLHEVEVVITSPDNEVKTFNTPTLKPHDSIDVGWAKLDGWPIPEGSSVQVSCKGFLASSGPWKI